MRAVGPTAAGLAVLLFCAGLAPVGAAQRSRVALIRSGAEHPVTRQAETLLEAELRAAGFEVLPLALAAGRDLREEIEATSRAEQAIAAIAIVPGAQSAAVELWVSDRVTGKLVIRRIENTGGAPQSAPADLALRAVELLRGSLLEITSEKAVVGAAAIDPPSDVARFVAEADPTRGRDSQFGKGLGVGVSAAAFQSFSRLGPSTAPMLIVSYAGRRGLGGRAAAVVPAAVRTIEAREGAVAIGSATIRRRLLLAECFFSFRPGARVRPLVAAGAGVHHVHARGTSRTSLFPTRSGSALTPMAQLGAGAALHLGKHFALSVDSWLVLTRTARILVADNEAAKAGGLFMLLTAGLRTSF